MNKRTFKRFSGLVFRNFLRLKTSPMMSRLTALFLITILLMPCFIFNPMTKTNAQTKLPFQEPAPISAPPIPFQVSSSKFQVSSLGFENAANYFTAPELPEGFERARTSSPFSKDVSSFASSVSSIFTTKVSALPQPSGSVEFDFDGDDKADISRWRGTATDWQIKQSSNGNTTNLTFGNASSIIAPGDFDGDGKTDRAIFDAGTWTIKKSSDGTTQNISFGTSGDKPVTGDY
ncbi:MAG TPA: VCBS repeat-containing protein, partial [Pyrinomonadaceae bacterium]|nr:VCBS repeat-containing protein [Pyrinomonadaceae bacterium]